MALAGVCDRNPNLQIEKYIVLDVLSGRAVRLTWLQSFPERADLYNEYKAAAWRCFYNTSPTEEARYSVKAFRFLTPVGQASAV